MRTFLGLVLLAFFAPTLLAQQPTGSIEGSVTDPQGAIVQNASVSVRSVSTNATRDVTTNSGGHYRITELPPGIYEVRVSATNFKTSVASDIKVNVGQNLPLDVQLEIGVASEQVTVIGGGEAQIDRTDNTVSGVVGIMQIQNLPLNGRNFLDLAQLQPGTEKVDGANFDPTKANYTGVSIAGQAGRSTQITVDGGSVVDNVVGTTVQNFSQDIVQEFQIGISNYDLSTGASATGSVNIVSRSGSNDFHGNGFYYDRHSRFAAYPGLNRLEGDSTLPSALRIRRIPFDRQQFGGTFGGPIKKDRLFFFLNFERNNQHAVVIKNPPSAVVPGFAGFTPNPFNENLGPTAKLDWAFSSKTSLFLRYTHDKNQQIAPFPAGTGIVPRSSTSGIFDSNDQVNINRADGGVLGVTHSFSPAVTNDFRFGYNDFHNAILPLTPGRIELRVYDSPSFAQTWESGTNYITPQVTNQKRDQYRDDLTYVRGTHTFHFGVNEEHTRINGQFAFAKPLARVRLFSRAISTNPSVPAVLATEADFLNTPVRNVAMGIGNDILPFNTKGSYTVNWRSQFYATDTWKLTKNFTLNYGLAYRYDTNLYNVDQSRPAVIAPLFTKGTAPPQTDKRMISPRLGFAYDLGGSGKTVLRGGFGIYYDTTIDNLRLFERADLGPPGAELFLASTALKSPLLPGNHDGSFSDNPASSSGFIRLGTLLSMLPAIRSNIEANAFTCTLPTAVECFQTVSGPIFSSDFRIPYSLQYAAGMQRELPGKMLLQADFNYRKGVHEILVYDLNHAGAVSGPALNTTNSPQCATFSTLCDGPINSTDSSGFSTYKALLVRLDRRFVDGFQFTAAYTLSRLKNFQGDALGLGEGLTNLNNFRQDFGPGGLDRTQRLVLSGVWEIPYFRKSDNGLKKHVLGGWTLSVISTAFSGLPFSAILPDGVDLSGTTAGLTGAGVSYLPGTRPGSIGRNIRSVSQLNKLIDDYNSKYAGKTDPYGTPLRALAHLPNGIQMGGDSVISQDLRITKGFRFSESMKLEVIGEVFNLFNVANLTGVTDIAIPAAEDVGTNPSLNDITTFKSTARVNNVFGTGGTRAAQFGLKFTF